MERSLYCVDYKNKDFFIFYSDDGFSSYKHPYWKDFCIRIQLILSDARH